MSEQRSVLVTGATGNQGGAVVDHLLASETAFDVRGLTRDATSDAAADLDARGVTMVEGDLNDTATLVDALDGVDQVFAVTNFWTQGYDRQVQQGKNLADAAAEVGVDQFVFSGVGSHHLNTGVPHFDSAHEIERHAQNLGLPVTTLQPVFFYQNLEAFVESIVDDGTLALPLAAGVPLQMIDVDDLGRVAATALAAPEEYAGESFELAGDELTLAEAAAVLTEVTGEEVEAYNVPIEDAYEDFGEEFTVMCEWFNEVGYSASVAGLPDRFGFELTTLAEYLEEHGWTDKSEPASTPGWVKAFQ